MHRIRVIGLVSALAALCWLANQGPAAERKPKGKVAADADEAPLPGSSSGKFQDPDEIEDPLLERKRPSAKAGGTGKDPVEMAFLLPKTAVLGERQKREYERLKKEKGPLLRDALEKAKSASADEKAKAAREAKKLRTDIKAEIARIVNAASLEAAQKAQREAAKQPMPQPRRHRR
jgi:hypothetical protein